jgi:hypothetical protein
VVLERTRRVISWSHREISCRDFVVNAELAAIVSLVEAASRHKAEKAAEWRQTAKEHPYEDLVSDD